MSIKPDPQLHHVSVLVVDTARALDFYCGVLGLETDDQRPDLGYPGAWLTLDGGQIHLLQLPNPDPICDRPEHGGRDRHFALTVAQLEPVAEALQRAGIAHTLSRSGRRALFCRDPDGNAVEIIERSR